MKQILLFCISALSFSGIAQSTNVVEWAWTHTSTGNSNSVANKIVVDDTGNIYIAGSYLDTLIIENDTLLGSPSHDIVFVSKFNSNGDLLWLRRVDWGNSVTNINLDKDNDLYILCDQATIIVYNSQTGSPITYYNVQNSFVGSEYEYVKDFKLDSNNCMYTLSSIISPYTPELMCHLHKYQLQGDTISDTLWKEKINYGYGIEPLDGYVQGMAIDSFSNVYVVGRTSYYDFQIVSDSVLPSFGTTMSNNFIIQYDLLGNAVWLDTISTHYADIMNVSSNSVDSSVYITGYTSVDEVFKNDTLLLSPTNGFQIYLTKYDLEGNYHWSKAYPQATYTEKTNPQGSIGSSGTNLSIADNGNIYLKGIFTGSIVFAADSLVEDTSVVLLNTIADDVFITKLDPNGNPIWGKYAGNAGGLDFDNGNFYVDQVNDIIYMVGYNAAANNINKLSFTPSEAEKRMFVGKEGDPLATAVIELKNNNDLLLVYPNPSTGNFTISKTKQAGNIRFEVFDYQGKSIKNGEFKENVEVLNLLDQEPGMYFLLTDFGTLKLIKQ